MGDNWKTTGRQGSKVFQGGEVGIPPSLEMETRWKTKWEKHWGKVGDKVKTHG